MSDFVFDWEREARTGVAEAVLCEPKTPAQIAAIVETAATNGARLLLTRLSPSQHDDLPEAQRSRLDFDALSRTAILGGPPPGPAVEGTLISVYGGLQAVGAHSIVTLNRGAHDGLDIGTVLSINSSGRTVRDPTVSGSQYVKLPDESIGHMFVFRVFDNIAYALVMTAAGPIEVGDRFSVPDHFGNSVSSGESMSSPEAPSSAAVAAAH